MSRCTLSAAVMLFSFLAFGGATDSKSSLDQLLGAGRNEGIEKAKQFQLSLKRSQFFFVGLSNGTEGKDPLDRGVIPMVYGHVRANTRADEWNLDVTVWEVKNGDGGSAWRIRPFIRASGPDGKDVEHYDSTWQESLSEAGKVESLVPAKADVSKDAGIEGVQMFEIPYAKVDGEVHKLVIAIGDSSAVLEKAVAVPRTYIMFKWNQPTEFPISKPQ